MMNFRGQLEPSWLAEKGVWTPGDEGNRAHSLYAGKVFWPLKRVILANLTRHQSFCLANLLIYLEFPEFYRVYFHNLLIMSQILFLISENPYPFASVLSR